MEIKGFKIKNSPEYPTVPNWELDRFSPAALEKVAIIF
jgi:hypothetical protein